MSNHDSPILPNNFHGDWKILTEAHKKKKKKRLKSVRIAHVAGNNYRITYHDADGRILSRRPPQEVSYDDKTDTLDDQDRTLSIAFWRNPHKDVIFACHKDDIAWVAQRPPWIDGLRPSREKICRRWAIQITRGRHAARGHVELRYLSAEGVGVDLVGLFHVPGTDKPLDLYDILAWDDRVKSFNSIFRVRSLNYWPGDPVNPKDDRIFATFDNRFTLPSGHLGDAASKLGKLMPHESGVADDPDDDPDTGIWVGEPT